MFIEITSGFDNLKNKIMKVFTTKTEIKNTLIAAIWSAPTIVLMLVLACAQVGIL